MKDKNKQLNKMDIIRGIIGFTTDGKIGVDSPFHFYNLKTNEPYTNSLKDGDKLLGVVINDVFNICLEFNSSNGKESFGYIVDNSNDNTVVIQLFKGFNKTTFNPFEPSYELGEIISENITNFQNKIKWA